MRKRDWLTALLSRRGFHKTLAVAGANLLGSRSLGDAPAAVTPDAARPQLPYGVASGDVHGGAAVVWGRCDRPGRMVVEYATTEAFRDARRVIGPAALEGGDFTAKAILTDLPLGQTIFYRARFQDLANPKVWSEPAAGRFRTPPAEKRDVLFAWSGDTAGQGYGINPDWGGMRIYETMRRHQPDFFIHSGDHIYADNPIQAQVKLDDGTVWKNVVTEAKSKVAETLAEFHGNYAYNLLDVNIRRFHAEVPLVDQWDDHEVHNNWFPEQLLDDARYQVKSVALLAARAKRAFFDYLPIRPDCADAERVYRSFTYGPSLEVFVLDERSYRGPNTLNRQPALGPESAFLGPEQLAWLKAKLRASRATWKVIASDMPIGVVVNDKVDGQPAYEAVANGDPGPPLGRELEFADLFRFLKAHKVRNLIWLTADIHYAAAHYYDPAKATFTEFDPFWEFVAGPLNAGTFGPDKLDATFGPQVKFTGIPPGMKGNRPPSAGHQFFGTVRLDGRSEVLTVALYNVAGAKLYSVELPPIGD
jgi:alkaline phosphatase D